MHTKCSSVSREKPHVFAEGVMLNAVLKVLELERVIARSDGGHPYCLVCLAALEAKYCQQLLV